MLIKLGAAGIILGIIAAAVARRFPSYKTSLEDWAGGLFVAGAILLGLAFPTI